jgi:antitoxin ParD1/3/4
MPNGAQLEREAKLAELDTLIDRGIADAAAGRVTPADHVFDRLSEKYRAIANAKEIDRH